jgi:hypothetical protein
MMYDYARSTITHTGAVVYGPPRSRRGRWANRIRRLLRREERMEVYAVLDTRPDFDVDTVKVSLSDYGVSAEDMTLALTNVTRQSWCMECLTINGRFAYWQHRRSERHRPLTRSELRARSAPAVATMVANPPETPPVTHD